MEFGEIVDLVEADDRGRFNCPLHGEDRRSGSVRNFEYEERWSIHCFRGCKSEDILKHFSLARADRFYGSRDRMLFNPDGTRRSPRDLRCEDRSCPCWNVIFGRFSVDKSSEYDIPLQILKEKDHLKMVREMEAYFEERKNDKELLEWKLWSEGLQNLSFSEDDLKDPQPSLAQNECS